MGRKGASTSFGELLHGDLYQEEPIYNMTGLYYTIVADVIRATFNASVNGDILMFLTSTKDLLDISTSVFIKRDAEDLLNQYRKVLRDVETQFRDLSKSSSITPGHKDDLLAEMTTTIAETRRGILKLLTPILLTTDKVLTKIAKLENATGALDFDLSGE